MPASSIRSPGHKENEDEAVCLSEAWQGKIKIFYEFSPSSVECGTPIFHFSGKNIVCIIWRKSLRMQLVSRRGGPVTLPFLSYVSHLAFSTDVLFFFLEVVHKERIKCSCSSTACAPATGTWRSASWKVEITGKWELGPPGMKAQPSGRQ